MRETLFILQSHKIQELSTLNVKKRSKMKLQIAKNIKRKGKVQSNKEGKPIWQKHKPRGKRILPRVNFSLDEIHVDRDSAEKDYQRHADKVMVKMEDYSARN